jgi:hypothetical protein
MLSRGESGVVIEQRVSANKVTRRRRCLLRLAYGAVRIAGSRWRVHLEQIGRDDDV